MNKKILVCDLSKSTNEQQFQVGRNEELTLVLIATKSVRNTIQVALVGEGSSVDIFGIVLGQNNSQISLHTLQDHQAPHTRSNLLIKAALYGRSQFQYEGYIKVEKNAQRTDAYQRNENLMLSPEAKAESKPALEILANDVRCTHSATIGKVDQEQLFYLESRGINEKIATSLIVTGFFQTVLDKIEDKGLVERLIQKISTLNN